MLSAVYAFVGATICICHSSDYHTYSIIPHLYRGKSDAASSVRLLVRQNEFPTLIDMTVHT